MPNQNAFQPQNGNNTPENKEEKSYLFGGGQSTPSYSPSHEEENKSLPIWIGGIVLVLGLLVLIFGNAIQNSLKASMTADPLSQILQTAVSPTPTPTTAVATPTATPVPTPTRTPTPAPTPIPVTALDPLSSLLQASLTQTPTPTPTPSTAVTTTTNSTSSSTTSSSSGTASAVNLPSANTGGKSMKDVRSRASVKP